MTTTPFQPSSLGAILKRGGELAQEWPGVSPLMRDLMDFWKTERPQMAAQLGKAGALEAYARIQEEEALNLALELRKTQGMEASEAKAEARKQVLQMTPERWEEEDENLEEADREGVNELQGDQLHWERMQGDGLL